jgi:hypothetical protein
MHLRIAPAQYSSKQLKNDPLRGGSQNAALGERHVHGLEVTIGSAVAVVALGSRFDHGVIGAHTTLFYRHQHSLPLYSFFFVGGGGSKAGDEILLISMVILRVSCLPKCLCRSFR